MSNGLTILWRAIILIFVTLVLTKAMGKRNLWNMTPFNLICYVSIGIIAGLLSVNSVPNFYLGIIALVIWGLAALAVDYLSLKSKWIHDVINGKERVLIKNGKVMEENLSKVRMSGEELLSALRCKNIFNLADVEFAIMEINGDLNVSLKSNKKPITPEDLGKIVVPKVEPQAVILDGKIIDEGLTNVGLNQGWLMTELQNKGASLDNVFIGQVDSSGDLYLDLFDDNIKVPESQSKELLYVSLEKSQADLLSFALETEDEKAKRMYTKNAEKLKVVMEKLRPHLFE